jgi:acetyl-CoA carboxylase biotin carboxyl carrier protein
MGLTRDDLRVLLEAFEASTWQEMTVEIGGDRIHVSRRETNGHVPGPVVAKVAPVPVVEADAAPVPTTPAPAAAPPPGDDGAPPADGTPVVSPSVGLFWRAPSPDSPPFVEVGSVVGPEDTVGIVEVMKLMTPVPAGRAGTVSAVLADNGAMVEHGQALVLIAE